MPGTRTTRLRRLVVLTGGYQPVLHLNCRTPTFVSTLLAEGIPASGILNKRTQEPPSSTALNERVFQIENNQLPFPTDSFYTTVIDIEPSNEGLTDLRHYIDEISRVTKSVLLVNISPNTPEKTTATPELLRRQQVEDFMFQKNYRKHPLIQIDHDFESYEDEGDNFIVIAEKLPKAASDVFSLHDLVRERDLHMDMLRESGRRSEAHIARYSLASKFVRHGDKVLDGASGLGYGPYILRQATLASEILAIDNSEFAINYSKINFQSAEAPIHFAKEELPKLSHFASSTFDLIVSFETIEHLFEPEKFIRESHRLLTPGGRIICSVPNMWVDDNGNDPNPYHHHVFNLSNFRELISSHFLLEKLYAQTAGGGMKNPSAKRKIQEISADSLPNDEVENNTEWWIIVGMKDAWSDDRPKYRETLHSVQKPNKTKLLSFEKHYENPWLIRSMVAIGARASNPKILENFAESTLKKASIKSADRGAALCVLLYQELERKESQGLKNTELVQQAENYTLQRRSSNGHIERWKISLSYVLGQINLVRGQTTAALNWFERCAKSDARKFSALLATKTIRASFVTGNIYSGTDDLQKAIKYWSRGLDILFQVLSKGLRPIVRGLETIPIFLLRELTEVVDCAQQCATSLYFATSKNIPWRPSSASLATHSLNNHALHLREEIDIRDEWIHELKDAISWHHQNREELTSQIEKRETDIKQLLAWTHFLENARDWLTNQNNSLNKTVLTLSEENTNLRSWMQSLEQAKAWFENQFEKSRLNFEELQNSFTELQNYSKSQEEAINWHANQNKSLEKSKNDLNEQLIEIRKWTSELIVAKESLESQLNSLRAQLSNTSNNISNIPPTI